MSFFLTAVAARYPPPQKKKAELPPGVITPTLDTADLWDQSLEAFCAS